MLPPEPVIVFAAHELAGVAFDPASAGNTDDKISLDANTLSYTASDATTWRDGPSLARSAYVSDALGAFRVAHHLNSGSDAWSREVYDIVSTTRMPKSIRDDIASLPLAAQVQIVANAGLDVLQNTSDNRRTLEYIKAMFDDSVVAEAYETKVTECVERANTRGECGGIDLLDAANRLDRFKWDIHWDHDQGVLRSPIFLMVAKCVLVRELAPKLAPKLRDQSSTL